MIWTFQRCGMYCRTSRLDALVEIGRKIEFDQEKKPRIGIAPKIITE
jgi:hypothetical protein